MNPIDIVKNIMTKGANPKQMILKTLLGGNSNPMIDNLIGMAEKGNTADVETFARNMFKERGLDFDKEFSNFMKQFK